ncbi:MAG: DUF421 domain-containing protein [Ruminococcus sp.]|nr:DUF421 domain-containing protein [Candidatus Copronaster equi]
MLITLSRTIILYLLIIFSMRLMGKRQLGELQPSELVITVLISEIAAIPLQDNDLPFGNSIVSILLLVALEIINSVLCLKSNKFRTVLQGNSIIIIRDGVIDQMQLKRLRFTVDDLLDQLRQKDVFDISDVKYAIVETNGQLSVMLKDEKVPATAEMVNYDGTEKDLLCMVVSDGKILESSMKECNMTQNKIDDILRRKNIKIKEVLFMLADKKGNYTIVKKDGCK